MKLVRLCKFCDSVLGVSDITDNGLLHLPLINLNKLVLLLVLNLIRKLIIRIISPFAGSRFVCIVSVSCTSVF